MKKFAYIQYQRIPSPTAHTILVVKTAEAAAKNNWNSFLVIPRRTQPLGFKLESIHQYYNLNEKLKVKYLWVPEFNLLPVKIYKLLYRFSYFVPAWIFAFKAASWVINNQIQVIQSCNLEVIIACRFLPRRFRPKIIYEIHAPNDSWIITWYQKLAQKGVDLWLLSSDGLQTIPHNLGVENEQILVISNGFEPADYTTKVSRKKTGKFTIGYVGRFETMGIEKGIFSLIKAVALIKHKTDIKLLIVGGPENLAKQYRRLCHQLGLESIAEIRPSVKPKQVGKTIQELDIATMIYPDVPHFRETMSPMKAIEYMAAGVPIIASDLPACKRILGKFAMYVTPDEIETIAAQLEQMMANYEHYRQLALEGASLVQAASWQQRQKTILDALYIAANN